jgi:hypothetical protein
MDGFCYSYRTCDGQHAVITKKYILYFYSVNYVFYYLNYVCLLL